MQILLKMSENDINTETKQVVDGSRMKFWLSDVFTKVDHASGLSNIFPLVLKKLLT